MTSTTKQRCGSRSKAAMAGLLLMSAAVAPARAADSDAIARGQALADTHCSRCHATGPTGASPLEGAPPFRDLKQRYPVDDLAESLAEGIETGHPQMPEFTFTPEQIDDLLAYLKTL